MYRYPTPGRALLIAALVLIASAARAAPTDFVACAGASHPVRWIDDGRVLTLNGVGLREATVLGIDVYIAGLYLPARQREPAQVLESSARKAVRLLLLRDVSRGDMVSNVEQGFHRAAGALAQSQSQHLRRLLAIIPDLSEGDTFTLSYAPEHGLRVWHGRTLLGSFVDLAFARSVFAIWLGEPPLSRPLLRGMMGEPCAA